MIININIIEIDIIKNISHIIIVIYSNHKQKRNILFIKKRTINWFNIIKRNIINQKANIKSNSKIEITLIKVLNNFLSNIKDLIKIIIIILIWILIIK